MAHLPEWRSERLEICCLLRCYLWWINGTCRQVFEHRAITWCRFLRVCCFRCSGRRSDAAGTDSSGSGDFFSDNSLTTRRIRGIPDCGGAFGYLGEATSEQRCWNLWIGRGYPSVWAALSALFINILLGSFQLFLHSAQPLSEGGITPFSGVCQSGGKLHYPRRRGGFTQGWTDCSDIQPTTSRCNIITQSFIFRFGTSFWFLV